MKKLRIISLITIIVLCFTGAIFSQGSANNNPWSQGEYKRIHKFANATLQISNVTNDSFYFQIDATGGANLGRVKGTAYINDNTAVFDDNKGGVLKFTLSNDTIEIEASPGMSYYAGMGVAFFGTYTDVRTVKTPVESTTFYTEHKVFRGDQEKEFVKLVGNNYKKFTDTAHMFYNEKDLDNVNARVVRTGVRGLFGFMESIIMVRDSDNAIWAAVIDNDKVLYFTNTNDTKFVPITISRWHDRFKNKPIHLVK